MPIAGDDAEAIRIVSALVRDVGYEPVLVGTLAGLGKYLMPGTPLAGERLRQWLGEGAHGEMIWMEERSAQRAAPAGLWPEVQSVIALGMSYAPGRDPSRRRAGRALRRRSAPAAAGCGLAPWRSVT